MLGLCMQLNFHQIGGDSLYLYWPVILLGVQFVVLFNPIKMFYFRTRMWLLYSLVSLEMVIPTSFTNKKLSGDCFLLACIQ